MTREGDFKIGDFGISKCNMDATKAATISGTMAYFSYELKKAYIEFELSGERKAAINWHKSDMVSLGLFIINMKRLEEKADLNFPRTAAAKQEEIFQLLGMDQRLEGLLRWMLQEDPADRCDFI